MHTTTMKHVTEAEFLVKLRAFVDECGTIAAAARKIGASYTLLQQVLAGMAPPTEKIVSYFGLTVDRVIVPSRLNKDRAMQSG